MRPVVITMDPQPTLTAVCITFPDNRKHVITKALCTSKRTKKQQMCKYLNKNPEVVIDHLNNVFRKYLFTDVHFLIESQTRSKATVALEGFIKAWACLKWPNTMVRSVSPIAWQRILDEKPEYRKSYEKVVYEKMCSDDNTELFLDETLGNRVHDAVDTYLMYDWYVENHERYFK